MKGKKNTIPVLVIIISVLLAQYKVQAQGFAATATTWSVPAGGQQTLSYGNWGFNNLSGTASNALNDQNWSTIDINGDGKPDLVVTAQIDGSGHPKAYGVGGSSYWMVYLNTGSGFSATATNWNLPAGGQQTLSYGNWGFNNLSATASGAVNDETWNTIDVNGDGKPDLVVTAQTDFNGHAKAFGVGGSSYWMVYLNTGSGFATTATNWSLPAGGYQTISYGNFGFNNLSATASSAVNDETWNTFDINGDGKPDLLVTAQTDFNGHAKAFGVGGSSYWMAYLNTGSGFATTATNWSLPAGGYQTISYGNFGFNNLSNTAYTAVNDETWNTFDINGDGKPDLLVTAQTDFNGHAKAFGVGGSSYWMAYLNTGSGFATTATNWSLPAGGYQTISYGNFGFNNISKVAYSAVNDESWTTFDLNADGKPDLVVTAQNDASGHSLVFGVGSSPYWMAYLSTGSGFSTTATNWSVPAGGYQTISYGNWGFNSTSGTAYTAVNDENWSTFDVNGDGSPDLVVTAQNDFNGHTKVFDQAGNPHWMVYLNPNVATAIVQAQNDNPDLIVYPNPSTGKFIIQQTGNTKPIAAEVYTITGQKLLQQTLTTNQVDLSNQPQGIYFLKICDGVNTLTKKLVVE